MTRQLTDKQEEFCQYFAERGNATDAYILGYEVPETVKRISSSVNASKLLARPDIQARVEELREIARKRHHVTIDTLIHELDTAAKIAERTNNSSALIAATQAKAKLLGMSIEKQEISGPGGKPLEIQQTSRILIDGAMLAQMSPEQLEALKTMAEQARIPMQKTDGE